MCAIISLVQLGKGAEFASLNINYLMLYTTLGIRSAAYCWDSHVAFHCYSSSSSLGPPVSHLLCIWRCMRQAQSSVTVVDRFIYPFCVGHTSWESKMFIPYTSSHVNPLKWTPFCCHIYFSACHSAGLPFPVLLLRFLQERASKLTVTLLLYHCHPSC